MAFEEGTERRLGLRLGQVRGVEVWVHWFLIFVLAIQLVQSFFKLGSGDHPFLSWLVLCVALFVTVLLHEVGHVVAARLQGGSADRIVLWPLGGLAYCEPPQDPWAHFWVAAAGPLVNIVIAIGAAGVCVLQGWEFLSFTRDAEGFPFFRFLCQYLILWDGLLVVLNFLPCYPLDGGRMLHALLWARTGQPQPSLFATLRISQGTAVFALVSAILIFAWSWTLPKEVKLAVAHPFLSELQFGLFLAAYFYFAAGRPMALRMLHGEEEQGIFGYDFSGGYTSLERTTTRRGGGRSFSIASVRARFRKRGRAAREEREAQMRQRVDTLLEKIHREGRQSLKRSEARFLERASKLFKK